MKNKVCIQCGSEVLDKTGCRVSNLYDQTLLAKSKIIKLLECSNCENQCDKYIECDGTLILLDLALQNKSAFRHVLLNQEYNTTILRLALVTIIVDGYCRWASANTGGKFFEQEMEFYVSVGEALASLFVFLSVSFFIVTSYRSSSLSTRVGSRHSSLNLLEGLLMAYCTRFLKLGALLWITSDTTFLWTFVDIFFFATSVKTLQVLTPNSNSTCIGIMLAAHLAMHLNDRMGWMLDSRQTMAVCV